MAQKYYRINRQITAPTLRLLDEEGKQIDVVTLAQAFQLSSESGLDLVEIAGKAVPPVVKLIEFSKFKYQEAKKAKAEKKGTKGGETKEIQMTPFIGQGDYDTRVKKAKEFLTTGNKVKLSIKFQGRQIQKPEFGHQLFERFKNDLADISAAEGIPKLIGKRLLVTFSPVKKTKK
jgi:translation initiation factor IF-3